jgi:hypothetical protein
VLDAHDELGRAAQREADGDRPAGLAVSAACASSSDSGVGRSVSGVEAIGGAVFSSVGR